MLGMPATYGDATIPDQLQMRVPMKRAFLPAFVSVLLAACGGGGGSDGDSNGAQPSNLTMDAAAEGVYGGTLGGSTGSDFQMLALEDGSIWAMYGVQSSTSFSVYGFIQGNGNFGGGKFSSSNIKDFGLSPALAGTASGTYTAARTISGSVTTSKTTATLTGGPIPGSTYDYSSPASITTVSGTWSVNLTTGETASITISNTGALGGKSSGGCSFSGTVAPRASGKNVFDMTFKFGAAPCSLPNQTATGIAVSYLLANGKRQLIALTVDSTRTYGGGAFGNR
jgi:hypothetical protein